MRRSILHKANYLLSLQQENSIVMAKKDYVQSAEAQDVVMASEPVATAVHSVKRSAHHHIDDHDCIEEIDWNRLPSLGPFSEEEAIARIDKFEERLAKGQVKWVRVDDIDAELKRRHPWL